MLARALAAWMLLSASLAAADVTAPVESAGWAARCGDRLRARLAAAGERDFAGGRLVLAPGRVEYRIGDPRGQELVAALLRGEINSSHAWERDDQWNYPIEPRLVWRERREVPDYEAQVAVFRGGAAGAPSARRRTAFVAAARAGLDECIAIASRWRAPAGTIGWELSGFMYVEEMRVRADGSSSLAHHTDGGTVGTMGGAAAEQVDPVIEVLRQNDFCALRSPRAPANDERSESIDVEAIGVGPNQLGAMKCKVTMPERAWAEEPRARACHEAVIALRERLFAGKKLLRGDEKPTR